MFYHRLGFFTSFDHLQRYVKNCVTLTLVWFSRLVIGSDPLPVVLVEAVRRLVLTVRFHTKLSAKPLPKVENKH